VKIYTDLKTNLLDLVFCKREGWIEMTLHYGTQLLDAWHEAKAVSFASLTGPEEAWPVTVQRQASLGAGASATQRLHLGATGLAGKLGDAASVYQVTIKFDLGNAQEITIFMPPDLRAVLGPKAS